VAVAAKLEVEIWRRPKKINFLTLVSSTPSDSFSLGRTVSPQYMQNVTNDSQTDRRQTDDTVYQRLDR